MEQKVGELYLRINCNERWFKQDYICATGGTNQQLLVEIDKIHTFTGPGTFTVNCIAIQ